MAVTVPEEFVDMTTKGLWSPGGRMRSGEFAAARHELFTGPFGWPLLVLRRDALEHNIATMAAFAERHGLLLAPHGKTSMAPRLFAAQLAAGAWGMTLATAGQSRTARGFGVSRILLANELLDPLALRWLIAEREKDPDFEFLCYVDSVAGVDVLRSALADEPGARDFTVLVELGHTGGRTGVRTIDDAVAVARSAAEVPRLTVAGVSGYEGGLPTVDAAADYLRALRDTAARLREAGLTGRSGPVVVSAGGSAYFDVVADVLRPAADTAVILRSGSYVTHDDGFYAEHTPFRRIGDQGSLRPAFELWARVLSTPEPGLALLGMGKRDAPFDEGLPVPKLLRRPDGTVEDFTAARVTKLMDQHAFVETGDAPTPVPGDLVALGISHPCTAFDKWRVIPEVDADDRVVDLVHTYF